MKVRNDKNNNERGYKMIGFGTYLNDYLEYEGISRSDFAFRLGITPEHLNEIINGKTNMSNSLMLSIAKFTGIDFNFIARIENRRRLEEDLKNKFHNLYKEGKKR